MKTTKTARGFALGKFKDANGIPCSIQVSSAIRDERLLWLGTDLNSITIGYPWKEVPLDEVKQKFGAKEILVNDRMHLTQTQVKELLPLLIHFAETGELPEN